MRSISRFISIVIVAALPLASTWASEVETNVIYGEDNRLDWYETPDASLRELANSTVALIENNYLGAADSSGMREIKGRHYGKSNQLCTTEKFYDQSAAAYCSGFYVGGNKIVTAGHCINSQAACDRTSFVFGYAYKSSTEAPAKAAVSDIYQCKKILHTQQVSRGADYAVIEVDRVITNRTPLTLRTSGDVKAGENLVVIGHPSGLPTKVAGDSVVRTPAKDGFFVANLDTYGGNSGSAVFNAVTKEVEGILVRGEQDFEYSSSGCVKSKVCTSTGCRGEDVTSINNVLNYL